jgi:phage terminase small subunit
MNQRQELFCQGLFKGKSGTQAYIDAGYSPKNAASGAVQLSRNPKVQARLKELNDLAVTARVATVSQRKERLSEIINARYSDFVTCGADGPYVDLGPETPNAGAVSAIHSRTKRDKGGNGETQYTSIELHDPVKAIAELNKMDGVYPAAKVDVTSKGEQLKPATYNVGNGSLGNVMQGLVEIGAVKVVQN